jgi:flagellar biogenesis protein FliO
VNPMHVVLVGLMGALLLVLGLITLATWVVAK